MSETDSYLHVHLCRRYCGTTTTTTPGLGTWLKLPVVHIASCFGIPFIVERSGLMRVDHHFWQKNREMQIVPWMTHSCGFLHDCRSSSRDNIQFIQQMDIDNSIYTKGLRRPLKVKALMSGWWMILVEQQKLLGLYIYTHKYTQLIAYKESMCFSPPSSHQEVM